MMLFISTNNWDSYPLKLFPQQYKVIFLTKPLSPQKMIISAKIFCELKYFLVSRIPRYTIISMSGKDSFERQE